MPPLSVAGVKRKREVQDDEYTHGLQRQSILDISMIKLRTGPKRRVEPCLRRSVLILNTLKHIETELKMEGVNIHNSTEAAMNNIPEMSTTELTLDPLPDMSSFISQQSHSVHMPIEDLCTLQVDGNEYNTKVTDIGVADLMPCKPVFDGENQQESLPQSATSTSLNFLPSITCVAANSAPSQGEASNTLAHVPYLSSTLPLLDDPFSDIDITCDLDILESSIGSSITPVTSPLSLSPIVVSPSKLPSLTIEDILSFFPTPSHYGGLDTTSPVVNSVLNAQCSTYCRTDTSLDDLDNIMQILVGL